MFSIIGHAFCVRDRLLLKVALALATFGAGNSHLEIIAIRHFRVKYLLVEVCMSSLSVLKEAGLRRHYLSVPWDITESALIDAFSPYGNCRVEWPCKEVRSSRSNLKTRGKVRDHHLTIKISSSFHVTGHWLCVHGFRD